MRRRLSCAERHFVPAAWANAAPAPRPAHDFTRSRDLASCADRNRAAALDHTICARFARNCAIETLNRAGRSRLGENRRALPRARRGRIGSAESCFMCSAESSSACRRLGSVRPIVRQRPARTWRASGVGGRISAAPTGARRGRGSESCPGASPSAGNRDTPRRSSRADQHAIRSRMGCDGGDRAERCAVIEVLTRIRERCPARRHGCCMKDRAACAVNRQAKFRVSSAATTPEIGNLPLSCPTKLGRGLVQALQSSTKNAHSPATKSADRVGCGDMHNTAARRRLPGRVGRNTSPGQHHELVLISFATVTAGRPA